MKFKPNEIFKKYPDIEDIAIRLDESEKETKEKNKDTEITMKLIFKTIEKIKC